jgi:hypothetical protein
MWEVIKANLVYYVAALVAIMWAQMVAFFIRLREQNQARLETIMAHQLEIRELERRADAQAERSKEALESITEIKGALFAISNVQEKTADIMQNKIAPNINNLNGYTNELRVDIGLLTNRVDEIDSRTQEVKKVKDYMDAGFVFGWDPVASKFGWIKRDKDGEKHGEIKYCDNAVFGAASNEYDEDKDGIPGALHIKTPFKGPTND